MPYKPQKPCAYPNCTELTRERYCEKHKYQETKDYNDNRRDRTAQTFYESQQWRQVRKMKLTADPFCEECRKGGILIKAAVVDHIIPIKQGGSALDMNNLQSLCWSCHSRKSAVEGSRWGNV
jgi:5-methylcytosine-specific restriction protein A